MIEHVGFVTDDRERFERFWCGVLGYHVARKGELTHELTMALFGIAGGARTVRYKSPDMGSERAMALGFAGTGPDVEVHVFAWTRTPTDSSDFNRWGLNHVSLLVADKRAFADKLPDDVCQHWYENPGGWYNLFIRDYDGNWIEVRD